MRGFLANALVTAGLLVPMCVYAQPRGAPHSSFSRSAGSFRSSPALQPTPTRTRSGRTAATVTPGVAHRRLSVPPVTGTSLINSGQTSCLLNPSYAGSPYCRQFYPRGASLGFEPIYPYWLPSGGYDTEQQAPPAPEAEPDPLTAQVGNLAAEVEMMRQEQALRDSRGATLGEPMGAEEKPPTTLLVYRDGHQMEVQDYAIQGKTLWVFSDQMTRRVPLADLDLAATERLNGERGVEFVAPSPK